MAKLHNPAGPIDAVLTAQEQLKNDIVEGFITSLDPRSNEDIKDAKDEATLNDLNPKQKFGDLKVPIAWLPPASIIYEALAFKEGGKKYGPYNWREKKVESMTYLHALMRHYMSYLDGEDIDPESGLPHIGHMKACLGILADATETGCLVDNRPVKGNAGDILRRYAK